MENQIIWFFNFIASSNVDETSNDECFGAITWIDSISIESNTKINDNYNFTTSCNNLTKIISQCNTYNNDKTQLFNNIDSFWDSNDSNSAIEKSSFVSSVTQSPNQGECNVLFVSNIGNNIRLKHEINYTVFINDNTLSMPYLSFITLLTLNESFPTVYQSFVSVFETDSYVMFIFCIWL